LIEGEHSGPAWQKMMEREAGRMTYVAWRRDIEVRLISKTREDARHPEMVQQFWCPLFQKPLLLHG
jgi:hypothetical protein